MWGIGVVVCCVFQEQGFSVVVNYVGNEEKVCCFIEESGIFVYCWDVGDYQVCFDGCVCVEQEVGLIDVVVNNVGIICDGVFYKMSFDDWNEVMCINFGGCFNMVKVIFFGMCECGWGWIVNIGLINGQVGQYGQVNYVVVKLGIYGFIKVLVQEGVKYGVIVNVIVLGYIDIDMVVVVLL